MVKKNNNLYIHHQRKTYTETWDVIPPLPQRDKKIPRLLWRGFRTQEISWNSEVDVPLPQRHHPSPAKLRQSRAPQEWPACLSQRQRSRLERILRSREMLVTSQNCAVTVNCGSFFEAVIDSIQIVFFLLYQQLRKDWLEKLSFVNWLIFLLYHNV